MENGIMVSVCCLVYNHEKYLRQCLDGFIMQKTNFNFEVIIHDDASTDASADIIRDYEKKYPDIIKPIYQTENQYSKGINITWTYQYPYVKGKYIALCEGDDYWTDENKLQKQFDYIEKNPDCFFCSHFVSCVDSNGDAKDILIPSTPLGKEKNGCYILESEQWVFNILKYYPFQTSSYFFSTHLVKTAIPDFINVSDIGDEPLMFLAANSGNCCFISDTMSCYRQNCPDSWSVGQRETSKKIRHIECYIKMLNSYNQYSNYRYNTMIENRILKMEFGLLLIKKQYRTCLAKKYRGQFRNATLKARMGIIVFSVFPFLSRVYGWMK